MKASLIPAIAFAAFTFAGAAHAQTAVDSRWYVRGDVGATFQDEIDSTTKVEGDTGWTVSAAVGRQITSHFRAEGELIYSDADEKVGDGRVKVVAGLVNGYYDFDTGTKWRPFVGAGVGFGQVKLEDGLIDGDDTGLAYQLQAGVAYPINDRFSAQVAYRYLGITDVQIGSGPQAIDGDYADQAVTVGLTYKFGS